VKDILKDYVIKTDSYDILIETYKRELTEPVIDRLVEIRKLKRMTQQDVADATGIRRANISRIEGKNSVPSVETLLRYAQCLNVNLNLEIEEERETDSVLPGTIGIGVQNFAEIRENNYFYIDKTSFIKEWWESGDHTTLITRPRRFGKTLNMSMLEHFFSIKYVGRADLFEGLDIWKDEKYHALQGTYPVIYVSFANVKGNTYGLCSYLIRKTISDLYEEHSYLRDSSALSDSEKAYFNGVASNLSELDATMALNRLSKFLSCHYKKKVLIFLDEYDTPMQEAYINGYWKELTAFTKVFFNSTFKTNAHMLRAVMTGITRVSKESFFSDLNHLKVVSVSSDKYATSFGFTEQEVLCSLRKFQLGHEIKEVALWYDGFTFGKCKGIYNPWSFLNLLDSKKFFPYWTNSGSNELVSKLLREGNAGLKDTFEALLRDEMISCRLDEQIVYEQLAENEAAVLSLLVAGGYLKVLKCEELSEEENTQLSRYFLQLTNKEVKLSFYNMIRQWFQKAGQDYHGFLKALLAGDIREMNRHMSRLTLQLFSYFDTGKGPMGSEPERFYHGFVLGLLVELEKRYVITSNRESGFGRYDIMLEPREREAPAMILEFKVHDKSEEADLKATVESALSQIEEKQYAQALTAKGFDADNIRCYGFAFDGKKVLIGEKT